MRFITLLLSVMLVLSTPPLSAAEANVDKAEAPGTPAYYELSPSIVVNVKGKAKYIRCDVQLMTRDETKLSAISLHAPALRHELILLLSDQQGAEIRTTKGKEKLRKVALKSLQGVMKKLVDDETIDELFFTTYLVQ
ncbi:flagellar basal body-associated FliL family protein [Sedimenticola hydrogenitrophicus]|uniref:flagellar basal body-associated FliL family protein n=1 Tax=Sedimenticola hydrogenitrophicus TaxID=2967975 RepID=UPI0021A684DA|nr:flagellar basal body-associated FliL family protein [Sedimenticola hydrogenitrophicus]